MATPTPCPTSEYRERYRACRYDSTTSALARLQSMSARELSQGATPDSNSASAAGGSIGIAATTDSSLPRISTGLSQDTKSYVSATAKPPSDNRRADGSNDLISEGNTDNSAVAGAAGSDITASTDYGSKKSPDGAEDGLPGGLHRPDFLSKGAQIPDGLGSAPQTQSDMAAADAKREKAGGLSGAFDASDVDAVQRKLEQQH